MSNFRKQDENDIESELRIWFSGVHRAVVAGIGNSLRRDDFVGVKIVKGLRDGVSSSVYLIECETVPESFIEPIVTFAPSHVLIIDAALLNLNPGSSKLIGSEQLEGRQAVSTHALPLRIFCDYLARAANAKIALLLIQPKDTSFGEGLTQELQDAADRIARLLSKLLSE
ncbi:MAG: hydrogenase 3 maturation endopeptidase HyCI [Candidatus Bathyarchaeota archaeon]|jgi:hydrogenase 3 maturation protease|nr:hydrogenase 3 maturation endopeptidase HyCI [Candidatus Bathyarchaeota archaeon]